MLDLNWKTHVKNVVTERNENFPTTNLLRFNIHYNTVYLHLFSSPHRFFEKNKVWKTSGSIHSRNHFSTCFHRQSEIQSTILIFVYSPVLQITTQAYLCLHIPDFIFSFHRSSIPRKFHTSYQNSHS